MDTIEQGEANIKQAERDTNLASLLYVARKVGKLEGITETLGVADPRIEAVHEDLLGLYDRLVEEVGLSDYMSQQEKDLNRSIGTEY